MTRYYTISFCPKSYGALKYSTIVFHPIPQTLWWTTGTKEEVHLRKPQLDLKLSVPVTEFSTDIWLVFYYTRQFFLFRRQIYWYFTHWMIDWSTGYKQALKFKVIIKDDAGNKNWNKVTYSHYNHLRLFSLWCKDDYIVYTLVHMHMSLTWKEKNT